MALVLKILAITLLIVGQGHCANILYIHGVFSPSHHIWNSALARGLARQGHNVTFVSTDPPKKDTENLHYIVIENGYELLNELFGEDHENYDLVKHSQEINKNKFSAATFLVEYAVKSCHAIAASPKGLDKILSYPGDFKFDLVIYDVTCGPCLMPLVQKFNNPPVVGVSAFLIPPYTDFVIGGHKYPAYVPHYLLNFPQIMSFYQRAYNLAIYTTEKLSFKYQLYPEIERITRERFGFKNMPPILELEQKTKLLLLNSDPAVDFPEPLQPNMVLVGGLQIAEPSELPPEIKQFVESGKKGTVIMSLGTNILSNMLGNEILTAILKTFESLPDYNFIWKFESEPKDLPIKPSKNLMVSKFLPQNDLLAHPNLKAFITHGGGLSTQESMWYGKPMIGIPFIADQYRNIDKFVVSGMGVKLEIGKLKMENFREAILKVLETPSYTENARKVSKLFQDKPRKPLDTAIWWIEYVMRNPDAPFYRSPTLELGYLASHNYDIFLVCLVLIHLTVYGVRKLLCKLCGSKKRGENVKVKKN